LSAWWLTRQRGKWENWAVGRIWEKGRRRDSKGITLTPFGYWDNGSDPQLRREESQNAGKEVKKALAKKTFILCTLGRVKITRKPHAVTFNTPFRSEWAATSEGRKETIRGEREKACVKNTFGSTIPSKRIIRKSIADFRVYWGKGETQ